MKKHFIRAICILGVLVVLFSCCPLSAFAVDPVSASVIANSFAQAIAAYGASNGVAMTFDVGSTDGIGETVHELWSDFRAGTQDADDYDTLAAALFPNLYYKALSAAGTAAEAYSVGVSITSEYAEEFDNFYNWLLSGPAEMVQVDNQYYQFASAQIGSNSISIPLYSTYGYSGQPLPFSLSFSQANRTQAVMQSMYNSGTCLKIGNSVIDGLNMELCVFCNSPNVYGFTWPRSSGYGFMFFREDGAEFFVSAASFYQGSWYGFQDLDSYTYTNRNNLYTRWSTWHADDVYSGGVLPQFASADAALDHFAGLFDGTIPSDTVGVKAYTNAGIADIPDTSDPNYDALGRAKDIPLDIPWDDSLYGDGTGALSDAQSGAIADEIAGVLETDSVIPLVEEAEAVNPRPDPDDDPSGDPDDYAVLGLEDVFPFCIPFDIYAFLSALAADPVPPSFTCTFDFPEALGGTQTLELDFDTPTFNQLAQLLRLLELLAFIVGLALLTRSMFIRG